MSAGGDDDLKSTLDELSADEKENESLRARLKIATAERNTARASVVTLTTENDTLAKVAEVSKRSIKPPPWIAPKRRKLKSDDKRAIICAAMSDWHFTEYVNPAEMDGFNAYDMAIAESRLERYFQKIIELSTHYSSSITYEGVVLFSIGDQLSGAIHDLAETNQDTQLGGSIRWTEMVAAGITMLRDALNVPVHVPLTVGNHPRFTIKERTKRRVRDNLDWLVGQMLSRHFDKDPNVTFQIPEAIDVPVQVYDHKYLMNHGQAGGGGGIGGIFPPIMRLKAKKMARYDFDTLVIGHWHQLIYTPFQGLIVNGAGKGYDEFASAMAFSPEQAQQAMWLSTPEHGPTRHEPIFVADQKSEGW